MIDDEKIDSVDALEEWLQGKHASWARAVTLRAALRALPLMARSNHYWLDSFALLPFGALITSWMQLTDASIDIFSSGSRANERFAGDSFDFAGYRGETLAANVADASYHSADAQTGSPHLINDCVEGVTKAAAAFRAAAKKDLLRNDYGNSPIRMFMKALAADCRRFTDFLLLGANKTAAARSLMLMPLWDEIWIDWNESSDLLEKRLITIDPNYSIWAEWFSRRGLGERAAFEIPGDKGRKEDKAILRRLAAATDEDFWGKGYKFVNAELTRWLEEARARAASNLVPLTAPPALPAQNPNAITFRAVAGDKIDIDSAALGRQVKTDGGAQERYAEAISEARLWLDRCQSSNAGARLTRLLENYLAAAGERLELASHALLVQRGERLRQELARYEAADNMLPPIADELLLDGKGWRSAHNMMVGLDPVLHAADVAMLGPDRKPGLIPPQEIIALARDADAKDLLEEGVAEIVIEAAQLAPDPPDQTDRRTVWSIETAQNLIIEAFAIALNYPKTAAGAALVGTALYAALGVGGIGAISIMGSIRAAEYLVVHQEWILQRLGNTPTWQALIAELADWLKRVTPFNPN